MKLLPIMLNIEKKTALVIGAGKAAVIKCKTLVEFGCKIKVVAPSICQEMLDFIEKSNIELIQRKFLESDLTDVFLVVCCTGNALEQDIYTLAKKKQILCCFTKSYEQGDFIFPSYKKENELIACVSTNGKFPLLAKEICHNIDFTKGKYLTLLEKARQMVLNAALTQEQKKIILMQILEEDFIKCPLFLEKVKEMIEQKQLQKDFKN